MRLSKNGWFNRSCPGANWRFQPGLFDASRSAFSRRRALDLQLEIALQFAGVRQLKPPDILRILLQMAPSMRTASLVLMLLLQLAAQCQAAVFDVTKFGAKGDGTTDDYDAVLKAAAACAAALISGMLLVPLKVICTSAKAGPPRLDLASLHLSRHQHPAVLQDAVREFVILPPCGAHPATREPLHL